MGRRQQVIKLPYRTCKHEVCAQDIELGIFEVMDNRRKIAEKTVSAIFQTLESGKNFDTPLIVNQVTTGKHHLIDGNHRYEAIKRYLAAHPDNRVEIVLHIYDNLDEDSEKELYTLHNSGRKQSTSDFVQQYKEDIPIWGMMQKNFPVKVSPYGGIGILNFYRFVGAYLASKQKKFHGSYIASPLKFIEAAQELKKDDVLLMSEFIKEYLQAFGPLKNNSWFKTTPLNSLMRIWMDNYGRIKPNTMTTLFRNKLANDKLASDLHKYSGAGSCKFVRDKYLEMLNEGRSRDLFVKGDTEEEDDDEDIFEEEE